MGQCRLQGRGTHHTKSYHQNRPRPVTWRVPTNSPLVQGWAYPFPGHGHSGHRNPGPMYRDHPIGPLQQYGPVKLEAGEILSKCQRLIHHSYGPTFTSHKECNKFLRNYHIILHHLYLPHVAATILESIEIPPWKKNNIIYLQIYIYIYHII